MRKEESDESEEDIDIDSLVVLWGGDHEAMTPSTSSATSTAATTNNGSSNSNSSNSSNGSDEDGMTMTMSTMTAWFDALFRRCSLSDEILGAKILSIRGKAGYRSAGVLLPSSRIHVIARRYKLVLGVDLSGSACTVSAANNGRVLIDEMWHVLTKCLRALCCPMFVEDPVRGCAYEIRPELLVTILASYHHYSQTNGILVPAPKARVLVQGVHLNASTLARTIEKLNVELHSLETHISRSLTAPWSTSFKQRHQQSSGNLVGKLTTNLQASSGGDIEFLLDQGLFSLSLLPSNAIPGLLLLTDGTCGMLDTMGESEAALMKEGLRELLSRSGVPCSVIQVGASAGFQPSRDFGYVPDTEALEFIAQLTHGFFMYSSDCLDMQIASMDEIGSSKPKGEQKVLSRIPLIQNKCAWNDVQRMLLVNELTFVNSCPSRFDSYLIGPVRPVDHPREMMTTATANPNLNHLIVSNSRFPWDVKSVCPPVMEMTVKYMHYDTMLDIAEILTARRREGFFIQNVYLSYSKTKQRIHVKLSLHCAPNIVVEYRARTLWPRSPGASTRVEIYLLADPSFLALFFNSRDDEKTTTRGSVPKVKNILKAVVATDNFLRNVAYLRQETNLEGLDAFGHNRNEQLFADFWHIAASGDQKLSQWFDDATLDAVLLGPWKSAARLTSSIHPRHSAVTWLNRFFAKWSNFTLAVNVFVKLVQGPSSSSERTPVGFIIGTLSWVTPYFISVNLSFVGMSPEQQRRFVVEIRERISNASDEGHKLFYVCKKPMARSILVRYGNEAPSASQPAAGGLRQRSMSNTSSSSSSSSGNLQEGQKKLAAAKLDYSSPLRTPHIVNCLQCTRNIWFADVDVRVLGFENRPPINDVAFDLLYRQRLEEGFLVSSSHANLAAFYKEVLLAASGPLCYTVQYVLCSDSTSNQLWTETWIEPQVHPVTLGYFYEDVEQKLFETDKSLISELFTFDKVHLLGRTNGQETGSSKAPLKTSILSEQKLISAPFNVMSLLKNAKLSTRNCKLISVDPSGATSTAAAISSAMQESDKEPPFSIAARHFRDRFDSYHGTPSFSSARSSPSSFASSFSVRTRSPAPIDDAVSVGSSTMEDRDFANSDISQLELQLRLASLTNLSPFHQINFLMCTFLEKALRSISDCEVPLKGDAMFPSDLLQSIRMAVLSSRRNAASSSVDDDDEERAIADASHELDTILPTSLANCRCFVKVETYDDSFLLVLFPSYTSSIPSSERISAATTPQPIFDLPALQPNKPQYTSVSILVYECYRLNSDGLPSSSSLLSQTIDPNRSKNVGNYEVRQQWNQENAAPDLSDAAKEFMREVWGVAKQSYVKGVYASLIQDHQVDAADLKKAIEYCAETETSHEVDLSHYLNLLAVRSHQEGRSVVDDITMSHRFLSILNHWFQPVMELEKDGSRFIFFYYHPAKRRISSSMATANAKNSNAEADTEREGAAKAMALNQLELLEIAEWPFFLRLECSFRRPMKNVVGSEVEDTFTTFYLTGFPTSFETPSQRDPDRLVNYFDPSALSLPPPYVPSVATNTSATLRFVCLTVAPLGSSEFSDEVDSSDNIGMSGDASGSSDRIEFHAEVFPASEKVLSSSSWDDDDEENEEPDDEEGFADEEEGEEEDNDHDISVQLQPEHLDAVNDICERVKCMVSDEIVTQLLPVHPVTKESLQYVVDQLQRKQGEHLFSIDMHFIRQKRGMKLFPEEFMRFGIAPNLFQQLDSYFFLNLWTLPLPPVTPANTAATTSGTSTPSNSNANNTGSGAIVSALALDGPETFFSSPSVLSEPSPTPMWLLFTLESRSMTVHFHAPALSQPQRKAVAELMKTSVHSVVKRVNSLLCLRQLLETHRCSEQLIPAGPQDASVGAAAASATEDDRNHSSESEDDSRPSVAFQPGQFECPRVFSKSFPLLWRLKPDATLAKICSTISSFAIANRTNLFVFKGSMETIFYFRLSSSSLASTVEGKEKEGFDDKGSIAESTAASTQSELILDVFGVDEPGEEITIHFVELLESRIAAAALQTISSTLARNVTMKLTSADLDFLLPKGQQPALQRLLLAPSVVDDPFLFLLFLRQNVQLYLNDLNVAMEPDDSLSLHFETRHGWKTAPLDASSERELSEDDRLIRPNEFVFLFNSAQSRGSSSVMEAAIGQGLAAICVTVKDASSRTMFSFPRPAAASDALTPKDIRQGLQFLQSDAYSEEDGSDSTAGAARAFSVCFELWHRGSVNPDALMDRLVLSFRQTLCDWLLEKLCGISSPSLPPRSVDRSRTGSVYLDEPAAYVPDVQPNTATAVAEEFLILCREIMDFSLNLASASVERMTCSTKIPRWLQDDLLCDLRLTLQDVFKDAHDAHPLVHPVILQSTMSRPHEYHVHPVIRKFAVNSSSEVATVISRNPMPMSPCRVSSEKQFVLLAGLDSVCSAYGYLDNVAHVLSTLETRSGSVFLPSDDQLLHAPEDDGRSTKSRRSSHSHLGTRNPLGESMMFQDVLPTDASAPSDSMAETTDVGRKCFALLFVRDGQVSLLSYNISRSKLDQLHSQLYKLLAYVHARNNIVGSIFLQKMGLFYHTPADTSMVVTWSDPAKKSGHYPAGWSSGAISSALRPDTFDGFLNNPFPSRQALSSSSSEDRRSSEEKSPLISAERDGAGKTKVSRKISRRPTKVINLQTLLKRNFPEVPMTMSPFGMGYADLMLCHGVQFKQVWTLAENKTKNADSFQQVYLRWSKVDREKIQASDLETLLRWSRIVHFCRTPILFTELRDSLFMRSGDTYFCTTAASRSLVRTTTLTKAGATLDAATNERAVRWFQAMVETFFNEYTQYLKFLGLQLVHRTAVSSAQEEGISNPYFVISENLSIETAKHYFIKTFSVGFLLVEVALEGLFVSVNLYTVRPRDIGHTSNPSELRMLDARQHASVIMMKLFNEEFAKFRSYLHVNSFVYDFHLRYSQSSLTTKSDYAALDILNILQAFLRYNRKVAVYSRNRVSSGATSATCTVSSPMETFSYLVKNVRNYGFRVVQFGGRVAIYLVSDSPDFESRNETGSFSYTVIAYPATPADKPAPETTTSVPSADILTLNYFVLSIATNTTFPRLTSTSSITVSEQLRRSGVAENSSNSSNSSNSTPSIDEVTLKAAQCLQKMLLDVKLHQERDILWDKLVKHSARAPTIHPNEYTKLCAMAFQRPLFQMDPSLSTLEGIRHWNEVFDFLLKKYSTTAKELRMDVPRPNPQSPKESIGSLQRHLILGNPRHPDLLLRMISERRYKIQLFAVRRKPQEPALTERERELEALEQEHISAVVNSISYFLWAGLLRDR